MADSTTPAAAPKTPKVQTSGKIRLSQAFLYAGKRYGPGAVDVADPAVFQALKLAETSAREKAARKNPARDTEADSSEE